MIWFLLTLEHVNIHALILNPILFNQLNLEYGWSWWWRWWWWRQIPWSVRHHWMTGGKVWMVTGAQIPSTHSLLLPLPLECHCPSVLYNFVHTSQLCLPILFSSIVPSSTLLSILPTSEFCPTSCTNLSHFVHHSLVLYNVHFYTVHYSACAFTLACMLFEHCIVILSTTIGTFAPAGSHQVQI